MHATCGCAAQLRGQAVKFVGLSDVNKYDKYECVVHILGWAKLVAFPELIGWFGSRAH